MQYELYHDESKVNGYWHGILLVPVATKPLLLQYLKQVRQHTQYEKEIGLKKVKKVRSIAYTCASSWLQIGVGALMQKLKNRSYPVFLGKYDKGKAVCEDYLTTPIQAKFILFRAKNDHQQMKHYVDYGSKIETTFRIGMKGGLHFLGDAHHPIEIVKMHFDGHEHYRRKLNRNRIIGKLTNLKSYCSVPNHLHMIDDRSSNHTKPNAQHYDDCQLLQLTDLLVGSFRSILTAPTRSIHHQLTQPLRPLVEKYQKGPARMRNSRWYKGFCISQCYLENEQWHFESINYEDGKR